VGVPKKRKSHSATRKGRNHLGLSRIGLYDCPRCGTARRPHTVCHNCGTYASRGRERQIIDVEADAE
jgi:large subunit ribosomal protein L32